MKELCDIDLSSDSSENLAVYKDGTHTVSQTNLVIEESDIETELPL